MTIGGLYMGHRSDQCLVYREEPRTRLAVHPSAIIKRTALIRSSEVGRYGAVRYQNCRSSCEWGVRGEGWITTEPVDRQI